METPSFAIVSFSGFSEQVLPSLRAPSTKTVLWVAPLLDQILVWQKQQGQLGAPIKIHFEVTICHAISACEHCTDPAVALEGRLAS